MNQSFGCRVVSKIQNDSDNILSCLFGKFYQVIVYYFFKKLGKIRQEGNRPVVYKKARVLCFVDVNNFSDYKFAQENVFEWGNIDSICQRSRNKVK